MRFAPYTPADQRARATALLAQALAIEPRTSAEGIPDELALRARHLMEDALSAVEIELRYDVATIVAEPAESCIAVNPDWLAQAMPEDRMHRLSDAVLRYLGLRRSPAAQDA